LRAARKLAIMTWNSKYSPKMIDQPMMFLQVNNDDRLVLIKDFLEVYF